MDSHLPSSTTITDPISSLLNPNPTFFHFPNPNPTNSNHVYNQTFTSFAADQNNDVFLNPQPPVSSHANTRQDSDNHHVVGVSLKNPKKRTRASRRTPTTVLTTDTTNFRQMVQEFTGITTAPFSGGLDGFGGSGRGQLCPVPAAVTQSLMGLQNPMFGFQSLLQRNLADDTQLDGSSCSTTRYDEVDKLNSLCVDDETEKGLESRFMIKRQR